MTARASIILWSAGSGALLGLFIDALLVAVWIVASSLIPALGRMTWPRWTGVVAGLALGLLLVAATVLGALEGRLKAS
jgi:hypothetical protein